MVGLLKSLIADPKVMLWLGAAGLLVKFGVIYRLARQPLLALVLFMGLFYEVLDLTAWRIALASTVFMVGFWILAEGRTRLGCVVALVSGLFHKQAFAAALVLPGLGHWWLPQLGWPVLAGVGAVMGLLGIAGDLFESLIKRSAGVKDSSALIPGHGGMLDRVDAILFAVPFLYVVLRALSL